MNLMKRTDSLNLKRYYKLFNPTCCFEVKLEDSSKVTIKLR